MRKMIMAAAAAAASLMSSTAMANVTFDNATGTGYVGKFDIQAAFGFHGDSLQKVWSRFTFRADATTEYDVTCEWTTLTGGRNANTTHSAVASSSMIGAVSDPEATGRKSNPNYKGWNLTGISSTIANPLPLVGDICAGGGDSINGTGQITAVVQTAAPKGTLYAGWTGYRFQPIYTF